MSTATQDVQAALDAVRKTTDGYIPTLQRYQKTYLRWRSKFPRETWNGRAEALLQEALRKLGQTPPPPPPPVPPPVVERSVFEGLGGFVASASAFAWDSERGKAFTAAGGKWLAVQWGTPNTDAANRYEIEQRAWAAKWRSRGVLVLGWHDVGHVLGLVPDSPPMDGWCSNPEGVVEARKEADVLRELRRRYPTQPIGSATLGMQPEYPTGLLQQLDVHLLPECMPQEGDPSDTITNSLAWWQQALVPLLRLHPLLLFKPGIRADPTAEVAEARRLGARGIAAFTLENTPVAAFTAMRQT